MRITAIAFALLLPACMVTGEIEGVGDDPGGDGTGGGNGGGGGGGDGDGDGTGSGSGDGTEVTPRITASVDKSTIATELGKTESLALTINSVDGFAGPVSITPLVMDGATALTGWTVTAEPASVDLAAGGSANVTLAVTVPTDAASLAPTLKLDLGSTAEPVSVESTLTVANQYTITIPAGTGTGAPHAGLPAPNATLRLRMGAKVIFHNSDTTTHRIHANGGIDHQANDLTPGTDYVATPTDSATWYCHSHENSGSSRPILVQ